MQRFTQCDSRTFPSRTLHADLVVAGGGLAGLCAALAAARDGLQVILVQDRPVLGGNASSEVRLWANGATSHMGNNNRWAREGGIMGEIMEENLWRNKEGNPIMFDLLLLDMAKSQPGLTLLLNTAVYEVEKQQQRIHQVKAFNAINETFYTLSARQFCDATGDGVLGYLAGAEFREGAEEPEELDEKMAPGEHFGHKLGHSIYFYTKTTANPVTFVPPSFALDDITTIPRYKRLTSTLNGCDLWWLEWGGRLDTVYESETIKWELWKIVWGVWDHIKNSGEFPEAEKMTIEWVGAIPGKRESRRFMGDHLLCQQDIIGQRDHYDAVGYGGWSIDLHPADGVYSTHDSCRQFHSKGTYTIPLRSLYSRSLDNLFLTGRLISASHVAFGSARVMCTCGLLGEVVGRAAALCHQQQLTPQALASHDHVTRLQQHLQANGCYIPRQWLDDPALGATVTTSSEYMISTLPPNGQWLPLGERMALLLPVKAGDKLPAMSFQLRADTPQSFTVSLLGADKAGNFTPEQHYAECAIEVHGSGEYRCAFDWLCDRDRYVFIAFPVLSDVEIALTDTHLPGIMTVFNSLNARVAKHTRQLPDADYGVDAFDFWLPRRHPHQVMPALRLDTPLNCFSRNNLLNGRLRPEQQANGWVPDVNDVQPVAIWRWNAPKTVRSLTLVQDNDFDNAMETVQMGHPRAVTPHCITHYRLWGDNALLAEVTNNRHSVCQHRFAHPQQFSEIRLEIVATAGALPAVYSLNIR
ncbi:FAD-dependent oxidoreductase [Citrobacter amalonaticus]|uniref:FAD-dependent oxidoreductase n=1 Tax=Citrobacter amalonaticus TaxID=35703 RepID=A0A2S4RTK3_CITAM|nr:FAD-dependent oxidoreductase [Citrobacter amalonaticus]POT56719.1 FAD-dependent oxidoreductase [Citrobacter amalonaticus]POT72037.1 FAD-dependent oxidoreductase [Citrobacter amalonaticus]POU63176.1 FAD-dependent oxidoreductase [Citrobacter amalonaticus]POV04610.1 FAD-dependent oxidoreductase [Citrobacter amalonaticus]